MIDKYVLPIGASIIAPTPGIKKTFPLQPVNPNDCETCMHVGVFFDGTNNNADLDRSQMKDTNIVRLFDSYRFDERNGFFKIYIPGVGTPFPGIGENGESALGSAFAIGCEERVLFGLVQILNSIHKRIFENEPFLSEAQVKALCRNGVKARSEDLIFLDEIDEVAGLRMANNGFTHREDFFLRKAKLLESKINKCGKISTKECFLDVFGFSRGAAQARVFCSWLNETLESGKLAGVPVRIRFLGIMDSVASAGYWASISGTVSGKRKANGGWAHPTHLRIAATVENCVHMVAMHELRTSFPLDTVRIEGLLPPNCQEFAYPGAHSDVGGGYLPCELGVSIGKSNEESNALKLAQIPLNHMFECAVAAGTPLSKNRAQKGEYDPFAIAPQLQRAFEQFLEISTMQPRPLYEWAQSYLVWRWYWRLDFAKLKHVQQATKGDRELLIKHNDIFLRDADRMTRYGRLSPTGKITKVLTSFLPIYHVQELAKLSQLDDEAPFILELVKRSERVHPELANFFDQFVHDSVAGFDLVAVEMAGHWRFRKGFSGDDQQLIVMLDNPDDDQLVA